MKEQTLEALSHTLFRIQLVATAIKEETLTSVGNDDVVGLVRHFKQLRDVNEEIKKARKALDELEEHMSHEDIPDAFKRIGIKTINIDDVGRVSVSYKWGCSIIDGKKPESFQWLRNGGNGGIIIETINAQTLASFAKHEVEENGKELPSDLFTTTLRPYTSITKA